MWEIISDENDLQTSDYFSESTPKSCKSIRLDHKYALSPTHSLISCLSNSSDTSLRPKKSKSIKKRFKRRKLFDGEIDSNDKREQHLTPLSERQQLAIALQLSSNSSENSSHNTFNTNKSLFATNNALKTSVQRVRRNHKGETGLHIAAIKGDLNRVKQIIADNKYHIDCTDFAGWSPIHEACNRGHISIVEELLKAGSDVNLRGYNGDTPLIDAAVNGHYNLVELLIKYGADYTLKNNCDKSAVELTKSVKVIEIITCFEEKMRRNGINSKDINKSRSSSPSNTTSPLKPSSPRLTLRIQTIKDSKQTTGVVNTTVSGPSMTSTKSYSVSTASDKELTNELTEKQNENNNKINNSNGNTLETVSASSDHNYTSVDSSLISASDESSRSRKRRKSNDGSVSSTSTTGGPSPRSGSSLSNTSNQSSNYNNKKHHNQSPHHSHHYHVNHSNKSKDNKEKNSKKLFSSSSDSDGIEGNECDKESNPKDNTSNGTTNVGSIETNAPKVPPLRIVLPVNTSNTTSSSIASTASNAGTHSSLSSNVTSSTSVSGAKFPYVVTSEESFQSESECNSGAVSSQRITRSSQRVAQQQSQKSSNSSAEHHSDSEESALHNSNTDSQHPRKRKIRNNNTNENKNNSNNNNNNNGSNGDNNDNDSSSSTSSVNLIPKDISPFALPQTNCYQMFLSIRKNVDKKRREMFSVPPKAPQGFDDYLINRCSYMLADNKKANSITGPSPPPPTTTSSTISKPTLAAPPSTLSASRMHEVFVEQEKERYKLKVQQLIERQKLILSSEQEVLRVHGRAARAMANQNVPFSVCSILKDEEIYNIFDSETEQNDISNQIKSDKGLTAGTSGLSANRTRYNGRLFLSWLQDVSDKWEKTKKVMLLRHRKESESLLAMQRLEWEWKLKEFGLCDLKTSPNIDDKHVPKVNVSDNFELPVE